MHIYKGVHTLIQKEHMHLHKEVHAFGQEVVMRALRNTRTRQGNRCPWIWKYMHIRQGAHVLLQDCENGFPRHSMPSASLFRCGMTREQRGRRFLQGRLNVIYFGDYELLRSHPRRNRQREKPMRGCWQARKRRAAVNTCAISPSPQQGMLQHLSSLRIHCLPIWPHYGLCHKRLVQLSACQNTQAERAHSLRLACNTHAEEVGKVFKSILQRYNDALKGQL